MKKLKTYQVADDILENVPIADSTASHFNKYSKGGKSTTWIEVSENELKYLQQFNLNNIKYCGYLSEPYTLFLDHAKKLSDQVEAIKRSLKDKVITTRSLNDNFTFSILEQNTFDDYLIYKINFIIFLIMTLESYLNNIIPDSIVFEGKGKFEIECKLSIRQKLIDVVPLFKFFPNPKEYERKYSEMIRLNELRNNFVHLKTRALKNNMDSYVKDFEAILRIDSKKEFGAISNFIMYIDSQKNIS